MSVYPARLILGISFGLACLGHGQTHVRTGLRHDSWSTESGLPQNSVHQILQTDDGFLWIATEGGAARYDGYSFSIYSHDTDPAFTSNDVTSIAEDGRGRLWFGTADGLVQYTNGRTTHFGTAAGLASASVLSVTAADDGSILILTPKAVQRFDGFRFDSLPVDPASIDSIKRQPDGSVILFGMNEVKKYAHGRVSASPLGTGNFGENLLGGMPHAPGSTWLWTRTEVRVFGNAGTSVWHTGKELPGTKIQTVMVDRDGTAWVGTNRGLSTMRAGEHAQLVHELGNDSVLAVLQDREGDVWIGTDNTGLHALRPRAFSASPGMTDEDVSCMAPASDGSIWVGTRQDGLRRIAPNAAAVRPVPNAALTSPFILALAGGGAGEMWVGTPDGLTRVTHSGETKRYTSSDGLPDDMVRSLLFARDGTLWIGTRHGIARLSSGRIVAVTGMTSLGTDAIGPIHESLTGDLWIGTGSGVFRSHNGHLERLTVQDGRNVGPVTSIAEDRVGRLWFGTQGTGLYLWDGSNLLSKQAAAVPSEVYALALDAAGFLWIRAPHRLIRTPIEDLVSCAGPRCDLSSTWFTAADGLPTDEFLYDSRPSILSTSFGEIWVATRKGIGIAHAKAVPMNRTPIPVQIESFLRNETELPISTRSRFPSGNARYTFEYAGLSYVNPSKVVYRTRLEGLDRDWSAPTNRRSISYTSLPAGKYVFRVQAANNDGLWNVSGTELPFEISPPYYRRWWFLFVVCCALVVTGVVLYRLRMRRLRHSFEAVLAERSRIAREIHDTLAQDLVAVSLQLNLVSKLLHTHQVSGAAEQLRTTRTLVTDSLEQARRSIWNLRRHSEPATLPSEVTALAEYFSKNGLTVKTHFRGTYRNLTPRVEEEVLKIMREAITNVSKHASAKEVDVDCHYERDTLVVTVRDDGDGFALAGGEKVGHFGMVGMRERAGALGGELSITSVVGTGTLVRLVVPAGAQEAK